jgi:glycosyltransferase involved in cell wall biosynthesis
MAPDKPQPDSELPTVSVAIPVFNEELHIDAVIERFAASTYPRLTEILVMDGNSTDRTAEKVREWSKRDPRVQLLSNPQRFQSYALNLAIQNARGDIFLRADAHCIYAPDYVDECVRELVSSRALNVGGAQRFIAASLLQAATALAVRSFFASGGALYKRHDYDGYAETVFLGCFWRKTLLAVGGYSRDALVNEDYDLNTRLIEGPFSLINVTNQDAELNMKLLQANTRGVYISSRIRVWYWPRHSYKGLILQYYKYGRGRAITSMKHRKFIVRGNAPGYALVAYLMFLTAEIATAGRPAISVAAAVGAGGILLAEAMRITAKSREVFRTEIWKGRHEDRPATEPLACTVALVFATMNLCHAAGYLRQMVRLLGTLRLVNGRPRLELIW